MDRTLSGKVALVTGAASGIGRGIAERFLVEGARVVLADINRDSLASVANALPSSDALAHVADITDDAAVRGMVAATVEHFGRLDIAVNAAYGIARAAMDGSPGTSGVPLCDQPSGEWAAHVEVGLIGPFLCVKHEAIQMLTQSSGGVIISIASVNARQPVEGMSAYCAAKAGLEMLTRCAALELGPHRIRVNAIAPGLVDTPMTSFLTQDPDRLAAYLRGVPLGRAGTTSDIASAAVYLASDEASWVSGESLVVDGAQLTRGHPRPNEASE